MEEARGATTLLLQKPVILRLRESGDVRRLMALLQIAIHWTMPRGLARL